jgi:cytoskeleton protein RodZ
VLMAAVGVYFLPSSFLNGLQFNQKPVVSVSVAQPAAGVVAPAASAASAPTVSAGAVETVFSAPPLAEAASAAAATPTATSPAAVAAAVSAVGSLASTDVASVPAASPAGGALQLRASAESWIEVQDAKKQMLLSRMLLAGETVRLDGELPLRLKVGNASGTEVVFRGQAVNLAPATVGNIARLELK